MKRSSAVLALLVIWACQPGIGGTTTSASVPSASGASAVVADPSTSPGAGGPTSPPPSPASTPPGGPSVEIRVVGADPVLVRGDGPPGHVAVLPAAAATDEDGSLVAFLVWFGTTSGDQVVTVARSAEGRQWRVDPTPILTDLGLGLSAPGPIPGAAFRAGDGTWVLYGWGARPSNPTSFTTWRATAPTPGGRWRVAAGEGDVLPVGRSGAWDDGTAAVASILAPARGIQMWYEGQRSGADRRGGIGYASSSDGVTWVRWDDPATDAAGDPVLRPGACGPGTIATVTQPQVWRRDTDYLMLFLGTAGDSSDEAVYGATSPDGIRWSCLGRALLRPSDVPGSEGLHTIQGITLGAAPALLVESLTAGGSELWLASVSPDR